MACGRWVLAGLLTSTGAFADPEPPIISIWYRSSEQCPDGNTFLQRLDQLGRHGRLAGAGDTIDFVVTLGSAAEGSFGRLERQTERGTVAMREVASPSCEEVADALALSLDLALEPAASVGSAVSGASEPASPTPSDAPSDSPKVAAGAPEPARAATAAPAAAQPAETARVAAPEEHSAFGAVGAQGLLFTGVADAPLWGGAVFGQVELDAFAARLSLLGATDASTVQDSTLRSSLFAARLEFCVWALGTSHLSFRPCFGADLGLVHAKYSGAGKDSGAWISPTLLGRGAWSFTRALALEAQIGLYIPLFRYDVGEPGETPLSSTDPFGLNAALGLRLAL